MNTVRKCKHEFAMNYSSHHIQCRWCNASPNLNATVMLAVVAVMDEGIEYSTALTIVSKLELILR